MQVKSFGCSFIYGSDLIDDPCGFETISPYNNITRKSTRTWPSLLAQNANLDYQCYASPGIGNLQIAERVLTEINKDATFFIIGWTWVDRFDYVSTTDNKWKTLLPANQSPDSEFYFKKLNSQYADKLNSLILINTVLTALKNSSHKFLMTYQDELLFETEWHNSPAVEYLQQQIKPSMAKFEGKTFLEWSRDHGYKISPNMHPLEDAHRAGAELMKNYFLV